MDMQQIIDAINIYGKFPVEVGGVVILLLLRADIKKIKIRLGIVEKKNGIIYPKGLVE